MLSGTPDTLAKKVIREGKECHAYDWSRPQKKKQKRLLHQRNTNSHFLCQNLNFCWYILVY